MYASSFGVINLSGASSDRSVSSRASRPVPSYLTPNWPGTMRFRNSGNVPSSSPAGPPATHGTSAANRARTSPGRTSVAALAAARVAIIWRREGFIAGHYTGGYMKWSLALVALACITLGAQQPTFRADVTLVSTDVI